jgi:hypothetical protein
MDIESVRNVLVTISILSPLGPIIAGIKRRSEILWWYAIADFTADITGAFLRYGLHSPYFALAGNIYTELEFLLVTLAYMKLLNLRPTIVIPYLIIGSLLYFLQLAKTPLFVSETFAYAVFLFSFLLLSLFGFYTILREKKIVFIEKSKFFWVNVAFLIYSSGDFILLIFTDYLRNYNDKLYIILFSTFFLIINILKNSFLGVALSRNNNET